MGLFNKFEPKRSHIFRKEGNTSSSNLPRSQSRPPVASQQRTGSRPPTSRRPSVSGAGLDMNGVSCIVTDHTKRRPSLSTRQPMHKITAVDHYDNSESSDESISRQRPSVESEAPSLDFSMTSMGSVYDGETPKPRFTDGNVDMNGGARDPYSSHTRMHGCPDMLRSGSNDPSRTSSFRDTDHVRGRSRSRQRGPPPGDYGKEVCESQPSLVLYNRSHHHDSPAYNHHPERTMSMREAPNHHRHISPQPSVQSMRDRAQPYHMRSLSIQQQHTRVKSHMRGNSRQRNVRKKSPQDSVLDMDEPSRLSTGTKMDLAYSAGYQDAFERAKADMMRHFN